MAEASTDKLKVFISYSRKDASEFADELASLTVAARISRGIKAGGAARDR